MTTVIAITGGIGTGKSTFSKEVKKRKLKLLDSDNIVYEIYKNPKKEFKSHLNKIGLGKSIKKNKINKKIIGDIIFSNKEIRSKLEKYIFKIVRNKRSDFIKREKRKKTKFIFIDIPLLFENNLHQNFDIVISIISSKKDRFKRLKKSKNLSIKKFNMIIKSQTTDIIRKKNSNIVIYNNSNINNYMNKINNVLNSILK